MVTRSEVDELQAKITAIEDVMPGIQIKSQQQDQSMTAAESSITAVQSEVATIKVQMLSVEAIIDAKIKTAIQMTEGKPQGFFKPILESKTISEVGKLTDAKSYRLWNRKPKNAIDQIGPT